MGCRRWRAICLALWLTLCGTPATATAQPDPPPATTGLAELLEARDAAGYRWPRARLELQEILADRLRLKAAVADTAASLRYRHRLDQVAAAAREDSLRSVIRWQGWDLEAARERRSRWWQSPTVVVPVTVLLTVWSIDVLITR